MRRRVARWLRLVALRLDPPKAYLSGGWAVNSAGTSTTASHITFTGGTDG